MEIKTYSELLAAIGTEYPNSGLYYRGLSDSTNKLIPSLYFKQLKSTPKETEIKFLIDFINESDIKSINNVHHSVWIKAFLGRHNGLRLRIMDWTTNISVALNFMINESKDKAALYVMANYEDLIVDDSVYNESYFDCLQTAMLNPAFYSEYSQLRAYKNRFIQNGKFLIQNYEDARNCYYERNKRDINKIEISQKYFTEIYGECCKSFDYESKLPIYFKDSKLTPLCEKINKG